MATLRELMKNSPYMTEAKIIIDDNDVYMDKNGAYLINVGYSRVSTSAQAEFGHGLDIQEQKIRDFARCNGMKNLIMFVDDGYTGTNLERPGLQAILAAIDGYNRGKSKIKIQSFITARFDRLSRNMKGALEFVEDYIDIEETSVHFIEANVTLASDDPHKKFLFNMFMSVAQLDRDCTVEKLKLGMIKRLEEGKWPGGGRTPYGYHYNDDTGYLEIIPEEAEKIREVFRLYIDEYKSPQFIADHLGFDSDVRVSQILKRKSLTGIIEYNGIEYQGKHPPIIDMERFQEAQQVIKDRSKTRGDSYNLLTGLLECGHCGAKMRYQQWNKKTKDKKIVCYSTQNSKPKLVKDPDCESERYWASDVEKAVVQELFKLSYLENKSEKKLDVKNINQAILEKQLKEIEKQIKSTRKSISRLDEEDEDIRVDYENDLKEMYREKRIILKRIDDEKEQEQLQARVLKAKNILRNLKSTWPYMDAREKQQVCKQLIDRVVIWNGYRIDVHLKLESYLVKHEASEQGA